MNDKFLNTFCGYYWPVYFVIAMFLNILLYWLILTKTTKVFKSMKYFLIPSNTANMTLSFIAFFFQGRLIYNSQSLAAMGQGWCKYIGPVACVYSYNLVLVVLSCVILVNLHTLYYRMVSINHQDRRAVSRRVALFSLHYIFCINSLVMSHIRTGDMSSSSMELVYNQTLIEHPDYNFDVYGEFGGFQDVHSIWNKLMTYAYSFIAIYAPTFGLYCRYKTLKVLDLRINSLSEKTIAQFKSVVHVSLWIFSDSYALQGLTLQVALPLFCYVSTAAGNSYNQAHTSSPLVIAQYTLTMIFTLPALFDPILNVYFIVPYRNTIKRIFQFKIVFEGDNNSATRSQGNQSSIVVNSKPITVG